MEAIPKGFVGQPAWHPDGEHLVIQVENENSEHKFYNHVSFGIDNDLWLVDRGGTSAQRIWTSADKHAALHPHFSPDGRRLIFAERIPTGEKLRRLLVRRLAPGGENQWTGWRIHIADADISKRGTEVLSNHRTIQPNGPGFYETHGFGPDGRIVYSFTPGGETYVDDSYSANPDGSDPANLTRSPWSWDEHAQFSPDGRRLAFISSRMDEDLRFPGSRPTDLRTELFLEEGGQDPRPITDMNGRKGRRIVVSDFDWDREGRRIVFQVADIDASRPPEIWMIDVR
jgi:Tol biopolymer transport system component